MVAMVVVVVVVCGVECLEILAHWPTHPQPFKPLSPIQTHCTFLCVWFSLWESQEDQFSHLV